MSGSVRVKPDPHASIFRFWRPLLLTWLFMSLELAFLAAFIARLPNQKENLAAYGLCLSFLLLFESPLLSIVSAAVSLVTDRGSYRVLHNYTIALGTLMSGLMIVFFIAGSVARIVGGWMGIDPQISGLVHRSVVFMILCPLAVGYRRLYQGILVGAGKTPLVSLGTFIRIISLALTCFTVVTFFHIDGAVIGGLALGVGMTVEAVFARLVSRPYVHALPIEAKPPGVRNFSAVNRFYLPLAASTIIGLASQPVVSAFVARSPQPIDSLAVIPVINSLVILFRSIGFSYQEVVIAFLSANPRTRFRLRRFGARIAVVAGTLFCLIAFSPFLSKLYQTAGGLSPELADFAVVPTRLLAGVPVIGVWIFLMRGEVIYLRKTGLITISCIFEVTALLSFMLLNVFFLQLPGAIASGLASFIGMSFGTAVLFRSHWINRGGGHPDPAEVALHTTAAPLELASE